VLKLLALSSQETKGSDFSVVAVSYRGFWTSKGRPSEWGIKLDAQAALQWVLGKYDLSSAKIVIWGQSIGAGVATTALANLLETETDDRKLNAISGLVLETPFVDLQSMLVVLYPQKLLPYRYLYPFLRSTWDSHGALQQVAAAKPTRLQKILILQAGSDEVVPDGQAELLRRVCAEGGLDAELKVIKGALHTEIMAKHEGRKMIAEFLENVSKEKCN
jgi:alpha-beta hydrolase superfamily lysophospholipase